MKRMNNTLLFSVKEQILETKKLKKLLAKEEEEEVQEDVQRDSKVLKEYMKKVLEMQVKVLLLLTLHVWSRKTIGRVMTLRKT